MGHRHNNLPVLFSCFLVLIARSGSLELAADRKITVAGQVLYIEDSITVQNNEKVDVSEVFWCRPDCHASNEAFLQAFQQAGGSTTPESSLTVSQEAVNPPGKVDNVTCMALHLQQPLVPGGSTTLLVMAAYTNLMTPRPASIAQNEPQRMQYAGSAKIVSPYPFTTQSTTVKLPSKRVESWTRVPPSSASAGVVTYGPYDDTAPWTWSPVQLHFENNAAFSMATSLVRELEVSHWGNVYVEEWYELRHAGAKLKGTWSRLDYQTNPGANGAASFRGLQAVLPPEARAIYFRDEIGNISSSRVRYSTSKVEALLEPRYPLFGGWSAKFVFGYSLPLRACVSKGPDGMNKLTMPFSSPIKGLVIDDLTVKVVLPEGASGIRVALPIGGVERGADVKRTYLDTVGRPVVVLRKRNAVAEHNQPFSVAYRFPLANMLQEPLLLVATFATLFACAIGYMRCDFSIDKHSTGMDRARVQPIVQRTSAILAERREMMGALHNLRLTRGQGSAAEKTGLEASLKASLERLKDAGKELEAAVGSSAAAPMQVVIERERSGQATALQLSTRCQQLATEGLSTQEVDRKIDSQAKAFGAQRKEAAAAARAFLNSFS